MHSVTICYWLPAAATVVTQLCTAASGKVAPYLVYTLCICHVQPRIQTFTYNHVYAYLTLHGNATCLINFSRNGRCILHKGTITLITVEIVQL